LQPDELSALLLPAVSEPCDAILARVVPKSWNLYCPCIDGTAQEIASRHDDVLDLLVLDAFARQDCAGGFVSKKSDESNRVPRQFGLWIRFLLGLLQTQNKPECRVWSAWRIDCH
jgi:hypothetical protein